MANTVQSNGSVSFLVNGSTFIGNVSTLYTMTGSNCTADVKNIALGSWQGLSTSSLSDVRYAYFQNNGSGSIIIATDSLGTKQFATLQTGDWTQISWSGSLQLYAQAYVSTSILTTIISEA